MTSTAEILERAAAKPAESPTREQLENNIKAFHNFRTAVRSGTFAGAQAIHITALLGLLDAEHDNNVNLYEDAIKVHPEWGKKDGLVAHS